MYIPEDRLNSDQLEAVRTTEGFVRVIAGAGSGKTRALTHRFAYLVNDMGVLPGSILCVTFTNKAANEMRRRIHNLTGDSDTGYINTFHGFCVSILREDSFAVGYPKSFLVLDNSDIDSMLRIIYEERGLTLRDMTFSDARDMIEIQKLFKRPEYYVDLIEKSPEELRAMYLNASDTRDIIFFGYLYQEKKCFGLDYNDLLLFSLYIFQTREEIKLKWQQRLEYIMIDEFQDIDMPQYRLMEVLCGCHRNLFIVGDPDQTIYTWRGADTRYLMDFDNEHPSTRTIFMNSNYRSTPEIISAVNSLIGKNEYRIKKDLTAVKPSGKPVQCHHAPDAAAEAEWICDEIERLAAAGEKLSDITILYRAHYVSRNLEEALLKRKLPYHIYSGVQFFNRMEIKDALSYLRMVAFRDDLAFMRIANTPKRNLGERRMKFLQEYAERSSCSLYDALKANLDGEIMKGTGAEKFVKLIESFAADYAGRPISELLSDILDKSGYEKMLRTEGAQERLDNLAELKQSVFEYETGCGEETNLESYLSHAALFSNLDLPDAQDRVKLMTVHAAKGLEFKNVFIAGMNEGVFPTRRTDTKQKMEEERRLAFVAMTRAEERLYLTEAEGRSLDGSPRYPSRFILDIDQSLLYYDVKPNAELIAEAREYIQSTERSLPESLGEDLFSEGQRVRHDILGDGTVVSVNTDRRAYVIKFDSLATNRTISFKVKLVGV